MTIMPKNMQALAGLPNTPSPLRASYEEWLRLTAEWTALAKEGREADLQMLRDGWAPARVEFCHPSARGGFYTRGDHFCPNFVGSEPATPDEWLKQIKVNPLFLELERRFNHAWNEEYRRRNLDARGARELELGRAFEAIGTAISAAPVECIEDLAIKLDVACLSGPPGLPAHPDDLIDNPIIVLARALRTFLPDFEYRSLSPDRGVVKEVLTVEPVDLTFLPNGPSRLGPEYQEWAQVTKRWWELNDQLAAANEAMFRSGWADFDVMAVEHGRFLSVWTNDCFHRLWSREQSPYRDIKVAPELLAVRELLRTTYKAEYERRGIAALQERQDALDRVANELADMIAAAPVGCVEDLAIKFDIALANGPGDLPQSDDEWKNSAHLNAARMLCGLLPRFEFSDLNRRRVGVELAMSLAAE